MIDTTHAEVQQHRCSPPPIRTWDDADPFNTMRELPTGTRFICDDCGKVAVVVMEPEIVTRYAIFTARRVWQQQESRRQRRERLGLRWWQRES